MSGYKASIKRCMQIVAAVCIAFAFLAGQARAAESQEQPIGVFVDLQPVAFEVDPFLENGTTLVQLRPLFEKMGISLDWNQEKRLITGHKGTTTIQLTIDEQTAYIDGQPVELERAATIIDGNTLVPLRFIGEATGAYVAWDGVYREITILSEQMMKMLKLTKEDLDKLVAQTTAPAKPTPAENTKENEQEGDKESASSAPVDLANLDGMYYGLRSDWSGSECGGMCWDLYTFISGQKVVIGEPKGGGPETIDCSRDTCNAYTIRQGTMTLDDDSTYDIEVSPEGDLTINGVTLARVTPASAELKLDGTYVYRGFSGLVGIDTFSSSWTEWMTFYPDGTFESDNIMLGTLDTKSSQTISTSSNQKKGTYTIQGNTLTLKKDGAQVDYLFFLHYDDPNDIQIGDRLFYVDED